MIENFNEKVDSLNKLESHRKRWMLLSIIVVAFSVFVILDWNTLDQNNILWLFGCAGITLGIVWWYWTMQIVKELLIHRTLETEILTHIYGEIKQARKDLQKLSPKDLTE